MSDPDRKGVVIKTHTHKNRNRNMKKKHANTQTCEQTFKQNETANCRQASEKSWSTILHPFQRQSDYRKKSWGFFFLFSIKRLIDSREKRSTWLKGWFSWCQNRLDGSTRTRCPVSSSVCLTRSITIPYGYFFYISFVMVILGSFQ